MFYITLKVDQRRDWNALTVKLWYRIKQEKQKGLYLKSTLDIAWQKELFGDQI